MIGAEQQWCTDLGFCKAVSARRRMVSDLAMLEIPGVITASLPEPDCALGVHWEGSGGPIIANGLRCEVRPPKYHPKPVVFLPVYCLLTQVESCRGFAASLINESVSDPDILRRCRLATFAVSPRSSLPMWPATRA